MLSWLIKDASSTEAGRWRGGPPPSFARRLNQARIETARLQSTEEILRYAAYYRETYANRLVDAFRNVKATAGTPDRRRAETQVIRELLIVLANTVALQERWIGLYERRLTSQTTAEDDWYQACHGKAKASDPNARRACEPGYRWNQRGFCERITVRPKCPRLPGILSPSPGQKYEIVVRPYGGVGLVCLTAGEAAKRRQEPNITHFKNTGIPCLWCPRSRGFGLAKYGGRDMCVSCPRGRRYDNGCCR